MANTHRECITSLVEIEKAFEITFHCLRFQGWGRLFAGKVFWHLVELYLIRILTLLTSNIPTYANDAFNEGKQAQRGFHYFHTLLIIWHFVLDFVDLVVGIKMKHLNNKIVVLLTFG